MLDGFINLVNGFITMLKYPLIAILGVYLLFLILITSRIIIRYTKGDRLPSNKGYVVIQRKKSILRRLFVDAPKQYTDDLFARIPGFFKPQGLIIYEGFQGGGKTSTMVHDAREIQKTYVNCKVMSNFEYKYEDAKMNHWKKLINYKNGVYGVIVMMDELQNWFNCNQSKNFPPEMLQEVTTNRKNRRLMMGTVQNFYMLAKNIRTQCTEVRTCITLAGCVTIVRRRRPVMDSDGQIVEWKSKGFYFWVHSNESRNSYDTYRIVETLSASGFKEIPLQNESVINNYIKVESSKKK